MCLLPGVRARVLRVCQLLGSRCVVVCLRGLIMRHHARLLLLLLLLSGPAGRLVVPQAARGRANGLTSSGAETAAPQLAGPDAAAAATKQRANCLLCMWQAQAIREAFLRRRPLLPRCRR